MITCSDSVYRIDNIRGVSTFDFDNSTGLITNPNSYLDITTVYGLCFSPNSKYLYIVSSLAVLQVDLDNVSNPMVRGSALQEIYNTNYLETLLGHAVLGPDDKIYIMRISGNSIHRIDNPNVWGNGANFIPHLISSSTNLSYAGSNTFVQPRFFSYTPSLERQTVNNCQFPRIETFSINSITNCENIEYIWRLSNIDNSQIVSRTDTSITFNFTQQITDGKVKVLVKSPCGLFSDSISFDINSLSINVNIDRRSEQCGNTLHIFSIMGFLDKSGA